MSAHQQLNKPPSNIYASNKNATNCRDDFLVRDYQNLSKLDIETPFMNIFDAIDRLLPFHIFHFEDSEINEEEEKKYRSQINDKIKELETRLDELENKVISIDEGLRDHGHDHEEDRYFGERVLTRNFQERYEKEKTDSALAVHATAKRLLQNKKDINHSKNPMTHNPKLWNYGGLSGNYKHPILQGKYPYHHMPQSNQIYVKNTSDNSGNTMISDGIKKQYHDNMNVPFISPNMNSYIPSKSINLNHSTTQRQNTSYVETPPISNLKQMFNNNISNRHHHQLPQLPTQNYNTTMFPNTTNSTTLNRTQIRNHGFIMPQSQNLHNSNESM